MSVFNVIAAAKSGPIQEAGNQEISRTDQAARFVSNVIFQERFEYQPTKEVYVCGS
jgi:hypothetical protein